MPMVEHSGETFDDDSSISKMLLDYGWVIPAAAATGYAVKKGYDAYQGLKSRSITGAPQPSQTQMDEAIDVPSRPVEPTTEAPKSKIATDFEAKFNMPFSAAEELSGGKITSARDAEIVGNAIKNKLGISVNPSIGQFDQNSLAKPIADPLAGRAPLVAPQPQYPVATVPPTIPVQPANVVATGPTPEAAAAPIEKAAEVKEVTTPTKAKTEPKIPKPEFFKNAPSAERWMYGSMTKYMDQPASAQAVVARAADYLPEGAKFEMQPGNEGGGIHPDQKQHLNRFVSEQLGIPLKEGKLPEDFKFTTENRNKLAASVQSELETHAKAGTLSKLGKGALAAAAVLGISEAVQAAQKGDYGPLREAGFNIGGPIAASNLGLTALSKAAGVPFGLATYSGGLNENEAKDLAYRRKVGASRGIAPPSAYMR